MRAKKATAHIIAVLPLLLLAAGFILEIIFHVCAKIDPIYWREHFISLISAVLLIWYPLYSLPCVIVARVLNRSVKSVFVNVVTWIDISAVAVPIRYYLVHAIATR